MFWMISVWRNMQGLVAATRRTRSQARVIGTWPTITWTLVIVITIVITVQAGVAMASAGELSFNWSGFISAMVSNLTFGFRAVWSKK